MLELQGEVENKDEAVRELMQKLAEYDSEERQAKQEAKLQTEELTEQIKMLQEQLLEVGISCLLLVSIDFINRPSPWRPPVYKMDTVFGESKLA